MATAEAPCRYDAHEEGEFVVFDDIPVFDEHEGSDGVVYDKELLAKICQNLNDAIEDSGDYAAVTDGHTNDDGKEQPEVLGFAGPFRLKKFGKRQPRWCIYGRFNIFKEKEQVFRSRPRRSVELWPEDKPENRYFDPIAVLGGESPRRRLGLVYQKSVKYSKATIPNKERYAMPAAPGGANTAIPTMEHEPEHYEEGGPMSEDALKQIIAAMKPVIKSLVAEMMEGGDEEEPPLEETPEEVPAEEPELHGKQEEEEPAMASEQYKKLHSQVDQYAKDLKELATKSARQEVELTAMRAERVKAERYAKLQQLSHEGYSFDIEEEIADCAGMTDEEWKKHQKRIEKYAKVPLRRSLPIPGAEPFSTDAQSEKYAKAAAEFVQRERGKGVKITYAQALEQVKEKNGAAK
jgi:hypothetical protein